VTIISFSFLRVGSAEHAPRESIIATISDVIEISVFGHSYGRPGMAIMAVAIGVILEGEPNESY
jgi:hypothetical protein